MLTNKYVRIFLEKISITGIVTDLNTAKEYQRAITNARKQFEDDLTSALILLSDEQQVRLLAQTLENFKSLAYHFDVLKSYFEDKNNPKAHSIANTLYIDYLRFSANKAPNKELKADRAKLLMKLIVSEEANFAKSMTYKTYAMSVSIKELTKWHSSNSAFAKTIKGATIHPSSNNVNHSEINETTKSQYPTIPLPWKYGVNDFAELLYKLERAGAIDLKFYFENGGTGVELARSFCNLFSFSPTVKNPVGTLNNYISELRKGLGNGPFDLGILKAIGRARNGTMDDILPNNPDQNPT